MSSNDMIDESKEYLFDIKISNFKIVLTQIIEHIEELSIEDDDEDDKNNVISLIEELVKQFDYIQKNIKEMKNDIELNKKIKTDLDNKIKKLNEYINDAEITIVNLNNDHDIQKNISNANLKLLNETKIKLENSNKIVDELENTIREKCKDIVVYQKRLEDIKKEEKEIILDTPKNLSEDYVKKMNESNSKLLQCKEDKIKELKRELKNKDEKINSLEHELKTKTEDTINLEILLNTKDTYISQLENNMANLSKDYNIKFNSLKNNTNLETEILIEKYKDEIEELKNKNNNLQNKLNSKDDLTTPLINNKKEIDKCCLCVIS